VFLSSREKSSPILQNASARGASRSSHAGYAGTDKHQNCPEVFSGVYASKATIPTKGNIMEMVAEKGAGPDVHKRSVVACVMGTGIRKRIRTYSAMIVAPALRDRNGRQSGQPCSGKTSQPGSQEIALTCSFHPFVRYATHYVHLSLKLRQRRRCRAVSSDALNSPYVTWDPKEFEKEISFLLSVSSMKKYSNGEMIYLQGETSRDFFFLKVGKVKISIVNEDGSEKILAIHEQNTFFGESSAFDGHPYFETAVSVGDSEVNVIPVEEARAVIIQHPEVSFMIIRRIVRKLRLLGLQVENFAFLDAQKRIARILAQLMDEAGEQTEDGIIIQKGITHEELANLTGLSRVRVTTILNDFERAGIITKKRLTFTITDSTRLQNLIGRTVLSEE
jgi:CRP/FNR family transcriptional regulator, cyclic AMP receptor protein